MQALREIKTSGWLNGRDMEVDVKDTVLQSEDLGPCERSGEAFGSLS